MATTERSTVVGVFHDRKDAEHAIDELKRVAFGTTRSASPRRRRPHGRSDQIDGGDEGDAGGGAAPGALTGGVVGGVWERWRRV